MAWRSYHAMDGRDSGGNGGRLRVTLGSCGGELEMEALGRKLE